MDMKEKHANLLGRVITNLLSIELLIRAFLNKYPKSKEAIFDFSEIDKSHLGDKLLENSITNYDTLGDLIKKYNLIISTINEELQIDPP